MGARWPRPTGPDLKSSVVISSKVLIVEEQAQHRQRSRLTDSLLAFLAQAVVTTVARAADAPAVLGRDATTDGEEHWFVICGLTPPSWSTLVLLEWIRRRGVAPVIYPALLTEVPTNCCPSRSSTTRVCGRCRRRPRSPSCRHGSGPCGRRPRRGGSTSSASCRLGWSAADAARHHQEAAIALPAPVEVADAITVSSNT